jgi:hypothetical protein
MVSQIQNNSGNYSLTAKQARTVGYLLTCRTVADAAEKAGVTERTVFAWLKLEGFRVALREASKMSIDQTSRRLSEGQADALDALSALMTRGSNESVRRAAAVDWLNLTLKYRDLNDLEERITRLEELVSNGE